MRASVFLERRRPAWEWLEELVAKCGRRGVKALSEEELQELTRLYPAVAVDVARARLYGMDRRTQLRLNRAAIAAHGLLYRARPRSKLRATWRFCTRDYPRLFRRLWVYTAASLLIFLCASVGTYATVRIRPSKARLFVPPGSEMVDQREGLSPADIIERFRALPNPPLAAGVMTNNIGVAFKCFALGITAGIGTALVLFVNGLMLGGFAAHFANHGLAYDFSAAIAAHGVLEIMAVVLAGGAGMRLGLSLAVPGDLTRGASLRAGAREAVLLVLGTIPMFIVAGVVEGFLTPTDLPHLMKIGTGLGLGLSAAAYLLLAGQGQEAEGEEHGRVRPTGRGTAPLKAGGSP